MAIRPATEEVIRQAMKGWCYLCANVPEADIEPAKVIDVINGVGTSGRFLGALSEAPSLPIEDERIVYSENIYGVNGPIKGGWDIQSTTYTANASILELSEENLGLIFPDLDRVGEWVDDSAAATPVVYGQMMERRGHIEATDYLSNVLFCFQGETADELGLIVELKNVINTADSKEFSPDSDGNIAGFSIEMTAHEDLANYTSAGGRVPPARFYVPDYAVTV